jgi:lipopolysaccharide export system permease protein
MVGKGLPIKVLLEFLLYSWLSLVPLALPLAILLASLMSFGDMGEKLELLAMKSAGVSLFRIMRSLMVFIVLVCFGAFWFSNNVIPIAQKKQWALLHSFRNKSPELNIPVGEFYSEIDNLRLYVRSKDYDTGALLDVMVYDFSKGFDNAAVTTADTVYVKMTEDKLNLKLLFKNGESFENLEKGEGFDFKNVPYRREVFRQKEMLVNFDANFNELDASYLDNQHVSKDIVRLTHDIDSVNVVRDSLRTNLSAQMREEKLYANSFSEKDTMNVLKMDKVYDFDTLFAKSTYRQAKNIMNNTVSRINAVSNDIQYSKTVITDSDWYFTKHSLEWHRKFTLSFACLIFFFIGAPLGAIIRKGGLGMPAVVAVVMFVVYYIIDTMGVKMAREAVWEVWQGMWLSSGVLLPVGIFLTYKAATDSVLFNVDGWKMFFKKLRIGSKE